MVPNAKLNVFNFNLASFIESIQFRTDLARFLEKIQELSSKDCKDLIRLVKCWQNLLKCCQILARFGKVVGRLAAQRGPGDEVRRRQEGRAGGRVVVPQVPEHGARLRLDDLYLSTSGGPLARRCVFFSALLRAPYSAV